jgi:hypothetical protein
MKAYADWYGSRRFRQPFPIHDGKFNFLWYRSCFRIQTQFAPE